MLTIIHDDDVIPSQLKENFWLSSIVNYSLGDDYDNESMELILMMMMIVVE